MMTVTATTPVRALVPVTTVTGETIELQTGDEAQFYAGRRDAYVKQNVFTETTDLSDLDRLLFQEVMAYRWMTALSSGKDVWGDPLSPAEEEQCRKNLKEVDQTISRIKGDLGLSRAIREKENNESAGAYIRNLQQRAKLFGIHRERQLDEALTLFNELSGILGAYDRSDELERTKLGFETEADIVDWLRSVAMPRFRTIDEHFRNRPDGQKYWLQELQ
jgi:hypothetical protein